MGEEAVLDVGQQQQQGMKTKEFTVYASIKNVKEGSDGTVTIEGYASTFAEDLDGETVASDAFKGTLADYMLNPIILANHKNGVEYVVGKTIDAKVDENGLWVKVQLSNSDDDFTKMVRTKVKEGLLKAFSIGGLFKFDYPTIEKVKLLEISIVPIPANPYALFSMAKAFKHVVNAKEQNADDGQESGKETGDDPEQKEQAEEPADQREQKGSDQPFILKANSDEESWDIIEKNGIKSEEGTEDAIVARFFDAEKADQFLNMLIADLDDGGNAKEPGRADDTDPRLDEQQQGEADDDPDNSKEEGKQQDAEDPKALYEQTLKQLTEIYHKRRKHDYDFS